MRSEGLPGAIVPAWDGAADGYAALMTTRAGGVSVPPWQSLNLGSAVGDDPAAVAENRRRLAQAIGVAPVYLRQVHGCRVIELTADDALPGREAIEADAAVTAAVGIACTVQVADCLPVLLAAPEGRAVGAAHAGWRGLAAGVVEAALQRLCALAGCRPLEVRAWLGPCIGPRQFEVGADVHDAFGGGERFVPRPRPDGSARWLCDLVGLARDRLRAAGVDRIGGGVWCTVEGRSDFFSFRRDGVTGRHAAAIWRRRRDG